MQILFECPDSEDVQNEEELKARKSAARTQLAAAPATSFGAANFEQEPLGEAPFDSSFDPDECSMRDVYLSNVAALADVLEKKSHLASLAISFDCRKDGAEASNIFYGATSWWRDLGRALRGMTQLRQLKGNVYTEGTGERRCRRLWLECGRHEMACSACNATVALSDLIQIMRGVEL